ncbi:hypothetical protein [Arthrobacter bambusae]|uniref:hypothetical protein n=1 Tax=Arthrobacter bambusae TaxID=1338426 RepID=UPI0027853C3C|nr:hypothetical protein [Arthrobacter bambusae]MDQ0029446.1 hypothetical protein [Arthrobacter bambusae]MDQ0097106.1 hypothetical protein [Arthrobacter bambusae]
MELAAIAVELYTLVPSAFTAARTARAKEAKSAGDPELAKQIARLPKPSTAAWAVNMLVRHGTKEFAGVVELGASLGRAQEQQDHDRLRTLGQQRPRVLGAAVEQARAVAEGLGVKVSGAAAMEIEATLRAAMTDPAAATALRSGQLVRSLATNGLEPVDLSGAVAIAGALPVVEVGKEEPDDGGQRRGRAEAKRERADSERQREKAQAALAEAERNADKADLELAQAEREKSEAVRRSERLAVEVKAAKDKLAGLQQELAETEWAIARAERNRKLAVRLAGKERRTADTARARLEGLP